MIPKNDRGSSNPHHTPASDFSLKHRQIYEKGTSPLE
jgi:hypothetical protein